MNQGSAFIVVLVLLGVATALSRKYLSRDARMAIGVIAAVLHLA